VNIIATFGMSQSSMTGASSWGLTGMVWSNLKQFALSARYTKMHFDDGKLKSISNFGATGAYAFGSYFGFGTYAYIRPLGKWGVSGANATVAVATADKEYTVTSSILLFYTKPFTINKKLSISPDIYMSGSPLTYLTRQGKFVESSDMAFMSGAALDYSLTKRFKFNIGLRTSFSTNPEIPMLFFGVIGSKMNL